MTVELGNLVSCMNFLCMLTWDTHWMFTWGTHRRDDESARGVAVRCNAWILQLWLRRLLQQYLQHALNGV